MSITVNFLLSVMQENVVIGNVEPEQMGARPQNTVHLHLRKSASCELGPCFPSSSLCSRKRLLSVLARRSPGRSIAVFLQSGNKCCQGVPR